MWVQRPVKAIAAFILLLLVSCANYADFSLEAYKNATGLKARSLALIAKSNEPYRNHAKEAEELTLAMDMAYEFARGMDDNAEATQMWQILRSPKENLVGEWLVFWRETRPDGLSPVFVETFRNDVSFAFDRLICLEANKREPVKCADVK